MLQAASSLPEVIEVKKARVDVRLDKIGLCEQTDITIKGEQWRSISIEQRGYKETGEGLLKRVEAFKTYYLGALASEMAKQLIMVMAYPEFVSRFRQAPEEG